MKVKELIKELQSQNQEMEVLIQQGEGFDYMVIYTVKTKEIIDVDDECSDHSIECVVIEYM